MLGGKCKYYQIFWVAFCQTSTIGSDVVNGRREKTFQRVLRCAAGRHRQRTVQGYILSDARGPELKIIVHEFCYIVSPLTSCRWCQSIFRTHHNFEQSAIPHQTHRPIAKHKTLPKVDFFKVTKQNQVQEVNGAVVNRFFPPSSRFP